jgi:hypothetical protein
VSSRYLVAIGAGLLAALFAGGGVYAAMSRKPPPIVQPIAFNHKKHTTVENEKSPNLACTECHVGAETAAVASLPSIDTCLRCHMSPQGKNAEEPRLRELASGKEGPFAWAPVTRNAGHVYFSHRGHTKLGGFTCQQCHGEVTAWTAPPSQPQQSLLSMDACIDCHRSHGAPTGCKTCHK